MQIAKALSKTSEQRGFLEDPHNREIDFFFVNSEWGLSFSGQDSIYKSTNYKQSTQFTNDATYDR